MWRQGGGQVQVDSEPEEEWETEPDFVNDVSEKEQRWGAKTVEGSGRMDGVS